jgi:hypothetical protein
MVVPMLMSSMPLISTMSPATASVDQHAIQALEIQHLVDAALIGLPSGPFMMTTSMQRLDRAAQ